MAAKKILVVDDERNIREAVAFLLRRRGYEILEAGDGRAALDKATSLSPDLIVLDAMMPLKTGFEVCAELKGDERWKKIPILMLTAVARDAGKSDSHWKLQSQADDFMSKPFKAAELVDRIEKLLGPGEAP